MDVTPITVTSKREIFTEFFLEYRISLKFQFVAVSSNIAYKATWPKNPICKAVFKRTRILKVESFEI